MRKDHRKHFRKANEERADIISQEIYPTVITPMHMLSHLSVNMVTSKATGPQHRLIGKTGFKMTKITGPQTFPRQTILTGNTEKNNAGG